jgi:two-component system, NtrC family, sensor histidine kinase HydH
LATDAHRRQLALPRTRATFRLLDGLSLVFLAGLAVLPPVNEIHKQLTLLAIGAVQLLEGTIIQNLPKRGRSYVVILKICLATLLIAHTGEEVATTINSSYYPIYYVPILTAALYFGTWGTLLWTTLASAAYCSYLYPAYLGGYELNPDDTTILASRVLFFFLVAVLVNRLAVEYRRQTKRYQQAAEALAETNRQLQAAQEEARRSERLAALGQMSAGLAHEIRNPLGVIKGSAEMLQQKLSGTEPLARELADYISVEVNRLSSFVTRFLDFARPQQLTLERRSVTAILDGALAAVAERHPSASVRVTRDYAAGLAPIAVDEELCRSAFVNLMQNAYEAMEGRDGQLHVSAHPARREAQAGVEIRIADSGPGISLSRREEVFNPFVTTRKEGTGLGLSIVSKIVDEHHGSIRIEDNPGGGACFVVFLPAQQVAAEQMRPAAS